MEKKIIKRKIIRRNIGNGHKDIIENVFNRDGSIHMYIMNGELWASYEYDSNGNLTNIHNHVIGEDINYKYNDDGKLICIIYGNGEKEVYKYNTSDNSVRIEYPSGYEELLHYSDDGKVISKKAIDNEGICSETFYEYDSNGNAIRIDSPDETIIHEYNDKGDTIKTTRISIEDGAETDIYEYEYNENGDRTSSICISEDGTKSTTLYEYEYYED